MLNSLKTSREFLCLQLETANMRVLCTVVLTGYVVWG